MKAVPDTACFAACLLIALVLRLAVILHEPDQLSVDRDAYLGIATSVAEGRGFSSPNSTVPTAYRPPLYPLTLALGFRLFPQFPVVAEINLLAGLLTVCLTVSLGKHLHLGRWRFLAALLVSIDPLLLQYSARPMTESICTCLTALWLWSVIGGWPRKTAAEIRGAAAVARGLVSGLTFGLLVLCRPTFWPVAGLMVLSWMVHRSKTNTENPQPNRVNWLLTGIGAAAGGCVTVAPWLIRNWIVFGVPILTTTHGGYTLLLGNNPVFYEEVIRRTWGVVWPDESQRQWEADRQAQLIQDVGPTYTEVEQDRWNSKQAWSYISSHPWPTIEASVHRVRSLWNTMPQGDAASGVNSIAVILVGCYYTVMLLSALAGMILVLRTDQRNQWLVLYLLIFSVQLVHLLYWTNSRMRAPLTPAMALFAAATITAKRSKPPQDSPSSPQSDPV